MLISHLVIISASHFLVGKSLKFVHKLINKILNTKVHVFHFVLGKEVIVSVKMFHVGVSPTSTNDANLKIA